MGFEDYNPKPQLKKAARPHLPSGEPVRLWTTKQLAEDVQMSERWVREQVRLGMPHLKLGHSVRYDPNEARQWLRDRYHKQRSAPSD